MFSDGFYQITGEIVASKDIKNSRNYAAGALGLKNQQEYWSRKLTFVPYDVQSPRLHHCKFWTDRLDWLCNLGFQDIRDKELEDRFPTDGYVWRVNSLRDYDNMGYTAHHPRGSFAVKEAQKPVVTTLREVTWQLGKSGVVSPVGHFDPIEIGGATIRKATLHNMEYIRNLGLEIESKILVVRSGEIIPRIVGRYDEQKNNS
jgi:DNA ligase (NAD+)